MQISCYLDMLYQVHESINDLLNKLLVLVIRSITTNENEVPDILSSM